MPRTLPPGVSKHIGGGGRATASSVPGGLFGAAPDPQVRGRLDGMAGGRGNSSSVSGGIFGAAPNASNNHKGGYNPNHSSLPGGIFGAASPAAAAAPSRPSPWEGAAGGRSTNQGQLFGHNRSALNGNTQMEGMLGGRSNNVSQNLFGHQRGTQPRHMAWPEPAVEDDFLNQLEAAEHRDEEDAEYLRQLEEEQLALQQQAASDQAMIANVAAQIAMEQGLGPAEQQALEAQLLAKLRAQAAMNVLSPQYPEQFEEEEMEFSDEARAPATSEAQFGGAPQRSGHSIGLQPAEWEQSNFAAAGASGGFQAAGGYRNVARRDPNASSLAGGIFA